MNDEEYKEWEENVEKAEKKNEKILSDFEKWLKNKDLRPKTIKNHRGNIDFYINSYLLYYEIITAENGVMKIDEFLSDFFIRKTAWASKNAIKEYIASFKKFYTFLNEIGKVSNDDLAEMKDLIKDEKEDWIDEVDNDW